MSLHLEIHLRRSAEKLVQNQGIKRIADQQLLSDTWESVAWATLWRQWPLYRIRASIARFHRKRLFSTEMSRSTGEQINEGSPYYLLRISEIETFVPRFGRHFLWRFLGMLGPVEKYYAEHGPQRDQILITFQFHCALQYSSFVCYEHTGVIGMAMVEIDNGNWAIVNLGIDYGNWAIVNLGIDYGNWAIVKFHFWFPTLRSHLSPRKPISMHEPEFRLLNRLASIYLSSMKLCCCHACLF